MGATRGIMQDLAMQYLFAMAGLVFTSLICWGYCWELPTALPSASLIAVKLANPGWLPRVLLIVPGYFHLTLRMALRFWVRHGFKIMFVIVTISLSSASRILPRLVRYARLVARRH